MHYDLHTHTTASDGTLAPAELLARAVAHGVTHLAITDHDTVAAYNRLPARPDLALVPGIELSTRWRRIGVHVLGLGIALDEPTLAAGIAAQQSARQRRAGRIAARLVRAGLPDLLAAAEALGGGSVGRPHFAAALVEQGHVTDVRAAFRRYLGAGKPGDVRSEWASLDEVIGWIAAAGGIAVLAHPAQYRLTRTKLRELVADFRAAGGRGLEVVSGRQHPELTARLAELADEAGLLASAGSDFHRPDRPWAELGGCPPLPARCRPVWSAWD